MLSDHEGSKPGRAASRDIVEVVLRDFLDIVDDARIQFTPSGTVEKLRVFLKDRALSMSGSPLRVSTPIIGSIGISAASSIGMTMRHMPEGSR